MNKNIFLAKVSRRISILYCIIFGFLYSFSLTFIAPFFFSKQSSSIITSSLLSTIQAYLYTYIGYQLIKNRHDKFRLLIVLSIIAMIINIVQELIALFLFHSKDSNMIGNLGLDLMPLIFIYCWNKFGKNKL